MPLANVKSSGVVLFPFPIYAVSDAHQKKATSQPAAEGLGSCWFKHDEGPDYKHFLQALKKILLHRQVDRAICG